MNPFLFATLKENHETSECPLARSIPLAEIQLKEQHQGYMKGYHYLMHIARMINEMALHSVSLIERVKEVGIQSLTP